MDSQAWNLELPDGRDLRSASTRQLQRANIAYKQPSGLGAALTITQNWIGPAAGAMGGGSPCYI